MSTTTMPRQATAPAPGQRRQQRSGRRALVVWTAVVMIVMLVVSAGAAVVDVLTRARSYDSTPTDAIAVLGASQYWGEPSPVFSNRLDHARDLWGQGVAPVIITVGGKIDGDITTEAEAGRQYLIESGVPADAVVALPGGLDTIESVEMIDAEMERRGLDSVTLVSDRVHLARSKAVASALGLDAHVSGRAFADGSSFIPGRVLREAGGVARFHVWDRWFLSVPDDIAAKAG